MTIEKIKNEFSNKIGLIRVTIEGNEQIAFYNDIDLLFCSSNDGSEFTLNINEKRSKILNVDVKMNGMYVGLIGLCNRCEVDGKEIKIND